VGITISTNFAKPKLEQKPNSLHEKNSRVPKYITIVSTTRIGKKKPLELLKKRLQVHQKTVGIFKKNENPYKSS
jgi:hypothetical protein